MCTALFYGRLFSLHSEGWLLFDLLLGLSAPSNLRLPMRFSSLENGGARWFDVSYLTKQGRICGGGKILGKLGPLAGR